MPKKGRRGSKKGGDGKKKGRQGGVPEYASDDERLYGDFERPDPKSRSYMYDDEDEFHAGREKILLDEGYKKAEDSDHSDEEVLGLDPEDSDDEEIEAIKSQLRRIQRVHGKEALASDLEDDGEEEGEEKGLPDSRAWGIKRNKYYGADDVELKDLEDEEAEAVMEEKEALKLQRQMAEQLDDQDFGLDSFKPTEVAKESTEKEEKIVKDLSKLSKREKLKLLKKESPELITLIDDFKLKMTEVQERLCPLRELIQNKAYKGKAADYINTKYKLNLNYCINILFYLMLKAKQSPVQSHPVIKRLLQYRNMMKQLEPLDEQIREEVDDILARLGKGEEVDLAQMAAADAPRTFVRRKREMKRKAVAKETAVSADSGSDDSDDLYEDFGKPSKAKKKAPSDSRFETPAEEAALEYYAMMKAKGREESGESDQDNSDGGTGDARMPPVDEEEGEPDGKRAITYQIEKNKGLTAKKKKELRNPRVKHRMKFRKAKIRRTGQFRQPRTETQKYGGEVSGIRMGVKRGVKLA